MVVYRDDSGEGVREEGLEGGGGQSLMTLDGLMHRLIDAHLQVMDPASGFFYLSDLMTLQAAVGHCLNAFQHTSRLEDG